MFESNNEIIQSLTPGFVSKVNASKEAMGIKHNRKGPPSKSSAKYKSKGGEIFRISINLSKGQIMTHKGKGKYPDNRTAKPFFNDHADEYCTELANELAAATGDTICANLCIR